MYVEISGRQTGKTTRLVEHAANNLVTNSHVPDYKICVVSRNMVDCLIITDKILTKITHILLELGLDVNQDVVDRYSSMIDKKTHMIRDVFGIAVDMWYVDEFDFIDSNRLLTLHNTYYCTTPKNESFSTYLLDYCRNRNIEVVSYDISENMRQNPQLSSDVSYFDDFCIEHELEMYPHPFEVRKPKLVKKWIKKHTLNGRNRRNN